MPHQGGGGVAGGEGGLRFGDALLRARHLGGVAAHEVIERLRRAQPADRRQHPKQVAAQEDGVARVARQAGHQRVACRHGDGRRDGSQLARRPGGRKGTTPAWRAATDTVRRRGSCCGRCCAPAAPHPHPPMCSMGYAARVFSVMLLASKSTSLLSSSKHTFSSTAPKRSAAWMPGSRSCGERRHSREGLGCTPLVWVLWAEARCPGTPPHPSPASQPALRGAHLAQPDALGVAAALYVEHPSLAPAQRVVTHQPPFRIGAERRLAGAWVREETGWQRSAANAAGSGHGACARPAVQDSGARRAVVAALATHQTAQSTAPHHPAGPHCTLQQRSSSRAKAAHQSGSGPPAPASRRQVRGGAAAAALPLLLLLLLLSACLPARPPELSGSMPRLGSQ